MDKLHELLFPIDHEHLKSLKEQWSQRDKRKTRQNRTLARKLLENILQHYDDVIRGYKRDDCMNLFFLLREKYYWVNIETLDYELYAFMINLEMQAEFPIVGYVVKRSAWRSGNYNYKLLENGDFVIKRRE